MDAERPPLGPAQEVLLVLRLKLVLALVMMASMVFAVTGVTGAEGEGVREGGKVERREEDCRATTLPTDTLALIHPILGM